MAKVQLRDVRKSYGNTEVIHGVSVDVADGEFIVIVGPSGCGKSTLLRMVAGLEPITAGEISIGERVVNRLEPKDRDVAMVFQNYALYPHMSVFDNMAYGLRIRGLTRSEVDARVKRAAEILELGPVLARRPRELSGGQRQRVAMGRAIVREPAAFLFDEPLSNLDAKLRVQMRFEIQKLHRRLGATSLYVTHDQVEAMTLAQRMIVMHAGRAEQVGTPMEVYESPASVFVAGFIGSPAMNFLAGTVEPGGRIALEGGGAVPRRSEARRWPQGHGRRAPGAFDTVPAERGQSGRQRGDDRSPWRRHTDPRCRGRNVNHRPPAAWHASDGWRAHRASRGARSRLFVRCGQRGPHRMKAWPYPRYAAHRGAGKLAPENTLAAMREGYRHGYRMVEFDVKLSADGVPFLLHDDTLDRTTDGAGRADALTWSQLAQLDAGSWHSATYAGEPLPTLRAVALWAIANAVVCNVEIKPMPGRERETGTVVAREVRALWRAAPVQPLLSSFATDALAAARAAMPELPRALLVEEVPPDWQARLAQLACVALNADWRTLDADKIAAGHGSGYWVLTYTVNDAQQVEQLATWGVDAIITDAIDVVSPE